MSRTYRQRFVSDWSETFYTTRNFKLTWNKITRQYPDMKVATRRYFYNPRYYIRNLRLIPQGDVQKEVVGTLMKDYSRQAKIEFWSKLKAAQRRLLPQAGPRRVR